MVRDGSGAALSGDLIAILSAVLAGVAVNFVRLATRTESLSHLLESLHLRSAHPLLRPGARRHGRPVGLLLLLGVGGGAFVGQALMASGYGSVPAGRGSVVFFWETTLTVLLGFLLAGERFNLRFAAGLVFILSGLWLNRVRRAECLAR